VELACYPTQLLKPQLRNADVYQCLLLIGSAHCAGNRIRAVK